MAVAVLSALVAVGVDRRAVLVAWVGAGGVGGGRWMPGWVGYRIGSWWAAPCVFAAVLVVGGGGGVRWSLLSGALVGAAVLGVPFAVLHLASPAGFGFGDVKFGVLVGLGLGVVRPGLGVVVFATAAVVQLVVAWCRPWPAQRAPGADRRAAPFGPSLAIAAFGWVAVVLVSGGGRVMRFLRPLLWLAGAAGAMVGFAAWAA